MVDETRQPSRRFRLAYAPLPASSRSTWFREYYDRYIRDEDHLINANYIENNPVKAGLVRTKLQWKWSSASQGETLGKSRRVAGAPS